MHAAPPDLTSLVLATLRTERAVTARFSLAAPWALRSDGVEGLLIRVCTGQSYWIEPQGQPPVPVDAGDIVLLRQGGPHTVASQPGLAAEPFATLIARHMQGAHGDHPITFSHGGGGAVTELFTLHLWMAPQQAPSLLSWLPPLLVLRAADVATTRPLAFATQSLVEETLLQRPGWQLATARMADLLLLHVVREHLQAPAAQAGWLRGLQDPAIARALARIHAQPAQRWSVAELARIGHQSRSVFSERFLALMGTTPMRYLTTLRMNAASELFVSGQRDVARVAQAVGYESDKAFARAFERWSGLTPSQYLQRRTAGAQLRRPGS
ncbi:MAG TPA: AraC family transcriptional regulator [Ramlibacter sp.]|nr:AraC family transcriptional regulator [Ramlibacter sp.]